MEPRDEESVFHALMELDPGRRSERLQLISDPATRRRLERLLRAADGPALSVPDGTPLPSGDAEALPVSGRRIGSFTVGRLLGRGGMGIVYLATQDQPARRVALKIIPSGAFAVSARRRFSREVEVLGSLRHAGVAQIFEAGIEDLGGVPLPWFAMEFVDGETIVECVRRRSLTRSAMVDLFAQVCEAVGHAHAKGVVHRDLKPSNILVEWRNAGQSGAVAQPKVLDFGVAKFFHHEAEPGRGATATGGVIGTIQYMSPEQARGQAGVGFASDVYSLGMILFELVAGRRPYEVEGLALTDATKLVTEFEPPLLRRVDAAVPRDLEVITRKALDKDPTRRYANASEMAADLRRWLANLPITAREPTLLYTLSRSARRNRALVIGILACVIALAAGAAATWFKSVEVDRARADVEIEREATRRRAYVASLASANAALRSGDVMSARTALAAAPTDMRGFEWWIVHQRLDESTRTIAPGRPAKLGLAAGGAQVCGIREGELMRWDAATLEGLPPVRPGDGAITAWASTDDGERFAFLDAGGHVRLNEPQAVAGPRVLALGETVIERLAWRGARLVLCERSRVLVLDPQDPTARPVIERDVSPSRIVALSPDGEVIVVQSPHGGVLVINAKGERLIEGLGARGQSVVAWSCDGRVLMTVDDSGRPETWDLPTGQRLAGFAAAPRAASSWAVARGGRRIACATQSGIVTALDVTFRGGEPFEWLGHRGVVLGVAFARDGVLWSGAGDRAFKSWPAKPRGVFDRIRGVSALTDGSMMVVQEDGQVIRIAEGRATLTCLLDDPDSSGIACVTPDGSTVTLIGVTGSTTSTLALRLHRTSDGHCFWRSPPEAVRIGQVGIDDERFVVAGDGRHLTSRRFDSPERIEWISPAVAAYLSFVTITSSGDRVACALDRGEIALLDARTGSVLRRLPGVGGAAVQGLSFDGTGAVLAAGYADRTIRLWDIASGRVVRQLRGPSSRFQAVAITGDGSRIAATTEGGAVCLWDRSSEVCVFETSDGRQLCDRLSFSRDGSRLLSPDLVGAASVFDAGSRTARLVEQLVDELHAPSRVRAALAGDPHLSPDEQREACAHLARVNIDPQRLNDEAYLLCSAATADRAASERAVSMAEAAVEMVPTAGWFWNTLGCAQVRAGRYADAVRSLERAAAMNITLQSDYALLALAEARLGHREAARSALARADALNPLGDDELTILADARAAVERLDSPDR